MQSVLLSIHLIVAIAMVAVILLQRSEGGGLGIGGGGMGGLMTSRGAGDLLTKTTKWLAVIFLANSIALSWLAGRDNADSGILEQAAERSQEGKEEGDLLPELPELPDEGGGL